MNYKVVIPVAGNREYADNCLASFDIDWKHLLIVDNTPDRYCKKYAGSGAKILYHPENIGCARSWNLGLDAKADWLFIVSIADVFPNGFSEVVAKMSEANDYILTTNEDWHCIALAKRMTDRIGRFDETFYPAYFEDKDYNRRMRLYGIPIARTQISDCTVSPQQAICSGIKVNFKPLTAYYLEKWGGAPDQETLMLPFGDKPLDWWEPETVKTLKRRYGL